MTINVMAASERKRVVVGLMLIRRLLECGEVALKENRG
jgi:hypothetical protein